MLAHVTFLATKELALSASTNSSASTGVVVAGAAWIETSSGRVSSTAFTRLRTLSSSPRQNDIYRTRPRGLKLSVEDGKVCRCLVGGRGDQRHRDVAA
jgi:hypothetical protein